MANCSVPPLILRALAPMAILLTALASLELLRPIAILCLLLLDALGPIAMASSAALATLAGPAWLFTFT